MAPKDANRNWIASLRSDSDNEGVHHQPHQITSGAHDKMTVSQDQRHGTVESTWIMEMKTNNQPMAFNATQSGHDGTQQNPVDRKQDRDTTTMAAGMRDRVNVQRPIEGIDDLSEVQAHTNKDFQEGKDNNGKDSTLHGVFTVPLILLDSLHIGTRFCKLCTQNPQNATVGQPYRICLA